ncbi:hypothetical protein LSTR_LSTR007772 [Laodelphax striatellus]|uniref:Uncharacterized protein n=1 Tax=Laodelphax striatellus TaxID=195883 RepID=A0A482XS31_LAOST|nr:hypothetical protein LSTR_LSTR007772 [Laodelphax striatellus]
MDSYFGVIFFLTILGYLGLQQTNACSILPGGFPMCFEEYYGKEVREIDFKREHKIHEFHVNPIDDDNVRLGQQWEESIGHSRDEVECKKYLSENAYKPEYETKMYDYRIHNKKTLDDTPIGIAPVTSLFVITKKEVWHCQSDYDQYLQFTRVLTEMASKEVLGKIFYYDGIEIIDVPIPSQKNEKLNSALVREIKYLHPENNQVLKYEGELVFKKPRDNDDSGIFRLVGSVRSPSLEIDDFQRDVVYNYKVPWSYGINSEHPEDGHIYTDDQKPYGDIGQHDDKAICELTMPSRIYTEKSLPYWNYWDNSDGYYTPNLIKQKEFTEHFIVTKHELWKCTIENKETFFRQELEYIGRKPMNTIEYFDGNYVWEYNINEKSKSVAIRSVHYFKEDDLTINYRYYGMVKLINPNRRQQGLMEFLKDKFHSYRGE